MGGRFATHLGTISFAFYTFHELVVVAIGRPFTDALSVPGAVALPAVILGFALAGAELLHRSVEAPLAGIARRWQPGASRSGRWTGRSC